jgi:hypothetical protein
MSQRYQARRIWFHDTGHLLERFPPPTFADLSQLGPLVIGQPKARRKVRLHNVVLRHIRSE